VLGVARAGRQLEAQSHIRALANRVALLGLAPVLAFLSAAVVLFPLWRFPRPITLPGAERLANGSSPRWLAALGALLALYACLGRPPRWLRAHSRHAIATGLAALGIGAVAVTGALSATRNVTSLFARPQSAELGMLRAAIGTAARSHVRRIAVVEPGWWQGAAPVVSYDEFGFPSTAASWVPGPAVYLILREDGRSGRQLAVDSIPPGVATRPHGETVVDMRRLQELREGWTVWTLAAARGS